MSLAQSTLDKRRSLPHTFLVTKPATATSVPPTPAAPRYTCASASCGAPIYGESAVITAVAGPGEPTPAQFIFCSHGCAERAFVAATSLATCPACNGDVPAVPNGRPRTFCSDRCRKQRQAATDRAMRRLTRGAAGDPKFRGGTVNDARSHVGDLESALNDLRALGEVWTARHSSPEGPTLPAAALADPSSFVVVVNAATHRLIALLDDARRDVEAAEINATEQGRATNSFNASRAKVSKTSAFLDALATANPGPPADRPTAGF
jgi:hypothetical protein